MKWFAIYARGHHGYPQPEDTYDQALYSDVCLRCGIHGPQVNRFRIRPTKRAANSHFLQLNWVYDAFFVTPEIRDRILASPLVGAEFQPVIDHKSGEKNPDRVQLCMRNQFACVETSRLQTVTCRPINEESAYGLPGPKRYPLDTPYCQKIKFHPPTTIALRLSNFGSLPDIFLTDEWFGSGGKAFRLTICSEEFATLVRQNEWRGLSFKPVTLKGCSERTT